MKEEIKKIVQEQTGEKVVVVSKIGYSVYIVETEEGNTYKVRT